MDRNSAFVARELIRVMRDSQADVNSALTQIASQSSEEFARSSNELRQAIDSDTDDADVRWLRMTLRTAAALSAGDARPPADLWTEMEARHSSSLELSASLAQSLVHGFWMSIVTAAIAIIVGCLYVIFVLPQFADMFASLGAEMPRLTTSILEGGRVAIPLVLLALIIGSFFFLPLKFVWTRGRRQWRFSPLAKRVWLGRAVTRAYRRHLFIGQTALLVRGGMAPRTALKIASQEAEIYIDTDFDTDFGRADDALLRTLGNAHRLGHLYEEIDSQRVIQTEEFVRVTQTLLDQTSFAIRLCTYALVGTLIIAMYLPIFKLGSAL